MESTFLQDALEQGLINFDEEKKYITYTSQGTKRNYGNPEEKVQAEAFCKLVLLYGYPAQRIQQFVSVKMGSSTKEADMIIYNDDECTQPYIIVECKHEDVSELEFEEAEKQAFSYAHALAGTTKFIWVTKGNKETFYRYQKERNVKTPESDIPFFGESDTKKFKFAKGGFYWDKIKGQRKKVKTGDIQPIPEDRLTQIFKQAHDALWAGGELNPNQAFDELDKLVFCKIWDERNTKKGEGYQFQVLSESPEKLKKRINDIYQKGKKEDPEVFNKDIDLTAERIKTIVEYFQSINIGKTDLDSKGKAFETFIGTYFRGEFGQYFTPRNVVKFAVGALPITNKSRVLDPACGSGGFLLYTLDKVRNEATSHYPDYAEDVDEYKEWYSYWHGFAKNNLYGIEINDQISRVAKMNMIIHDDGHTNVVGFDGLYEADVIAERTGNKGFKNDTFDFIVTNPPFGSIVKQSEKAYMRMDGNTAPYYGFALKEVNWIDERLKKQHKLKGRENQSTEVLFLEQCYNFLKPGGYVAIVIPDGILTNSSQQYVRSAIEEKFRIVAVISLPQTAFTHTGAGVKSSVLFLKKYPPSKTKEIRQLKESAADDVTKELKLVNTINNWEKEKREALKPLKAKDEKTKIKRSEISGRYREKINDFREDADLGYFELKQQKLPDYPIFMAIAESIGYDANGKPNNQNDLEEIGKELTHFIQAIEKGKDANFC